MGLNRESPLKTMDFYPQNHDFMHKYRGNFERLLVVVVFMCRWGKVGTPQVS